MIRWIRSWFGAMFDAITMHRERRYMMTKVRQWHLHDGGVE